MNEARLPRRLYEFLLTEKRLGVGHKKNGARFMERLANAAAWTAVVGKAKAKTLSKEYIVKRQLEKLRLNLNSQDAKYKASISELTGWTDVDNPEMPIYLQRSCPLGLRHGRRFKTQIRLGCHDLNQSTARQLAGAAREPGKLCKCCSRGVVESPLHALLECPLYRISRDEFYIRADRTLSGFSMLSLKEQMRVLFSDDTPALLASHHYRYLINVLRERKSWLADPLSC
jgi:hypothetical protein